MFYLRLNRTISVRGLANIIIEINKNLDSGIQSVSGGQTNTHGNKGVYMVASKLETYRAHNKTVEKTIFTGLTTKWLSKHICTETIRIKNTTKTKFTQGYFQFQKQHGRVGV